MRVMWAVRVVKATRTLKAAKTAKSVKAIKAFKTQSTIEPIVSHAQKSLKVYKKTGRVFQRLIGRR